MQTYPYIPTSTPSTIKSSDLQRRGGAILKRVSIKREPLVVEREGYPVAVMLSYPDYEQLVNELAARRLQTFLAASGAGDIPESEVDADALQATQNTRHP